MNLLVSFVIPCLNSEQTLGRALDSIFAQETEAPFEVIIVDNGSSDGTVALAQRYPVTIVHASKRGAGPARNAGVAQARGSYLAFIDSDVVLEPTWLSRILGPMQSHGFQIGLGRVIPAGEENFFNQFRRALNQKRYRNTNISLIAPDGSVNPVVNTAACVYEKSFFNTFGGFDERISRIEDTELSMRLYLHGCAIFASSSARAEVYNTGTLWGYLRRSWKLGMARKELARVTQVKTTPNWRVYLYELFVFQKTLRGWRVRGFYFLNVLASLLGYLATPLAPELQARPISKTLMLKTTLTLRPIIASQRYQIDISTRLIAFDETWHFFSPKLAPQECFKLQLQGPDVRSELATLERAGVIRRS